MAGQTLVISLRPEPSPCQENRYDHRIDFSLRTPKTRPKAGGWREAFEGLQIKRSAHAISRGAQGKGAADRQARASPVVLGVGCTRNKTRLRQLRAFPHWGSQSVADLLVVAPCIAIAREICRYAYRRIVVKPTRDAVSATASHAV